MTAAASRAVRCWRAESRSSVSLNFWATWTAPRPPPSDTVATWYSSSPISASRSGLPARLCRRRDPAFLGTHRERRPAGVLDPAAGAQHLDLGTGGPGEVVAGPVVVGVGGRVVGRPERLLPHLGPQIPYDLREHRLLVHPDQPGRRVVAEEPDQYGHRRGHGREGHREGGPQAGRLTGPQPGGRPAAPPGAQPAAAGRAAGDRDGCRDRSRCGRGGRTSQSSRST